MNTTENLLLSIYGQSALDPTLIKSRARTLYYYLISTKYKGQKKKDFFKKHKFDFEMVQMRRRKNQNIMQSVLDGPERLHVLCDLATLSNN